jgi:hypothetical protein
MEDLHSYTEEFCTNYCSLALLLTGIIVNYGIKERNYKPSLSKKGTTSLL